MRTTLTLDADVARMLREEAHRQRKPFKQVVNEALRRGLLPGSENQDVKPFQVIPHPARLRPGIDHTGFNRLADEMEDEAVIAKATRRRR